MKEKMLSTSKPIKIGFDIDEVLLECSKPAIDWANKKYGTNLTTEELNSWGKNDGDFKYMQEVFKDPDFVLSQKPISGAVEFIERLSNVVGIEIYFITAVPVELSTQRSQSLMKHFPWVHTKNYILTSSKDVAYFDIFVDDAEHNLFGNKSKYPIVKREKWNENITGMLSYKTFDELWVLITTICNKEGLMNTQNIPDPCVLAIIGPTGSQKVDLANELVKRGMVKPETFTNSKYDAQRNNYSYVENINTEDYFMATVYGKNIYAVKENSIKKALKRGKNVVMVVDMCGFAALKSKFPTISIFKDSRYEDNVKDILKRNIPDEEKTNRILSIRSEKRNMHLCDYLLPAGEEIRISADRIINTIK